MARRSTPAELPAHEKTEIVFDLGFCFATKAQLAGFEPATLGLEYFQVDNLAVMMLPKQSFFQDFFVCPAFAQFRRTTETKSLRDSQRTSLTPRQISASSASMMPTLFLPSLALCVQGRNLVGNNFQ